MENNKTSYALAHEALAKYNEALKLLGESKALMETANDHHRGGDTVAAHAKSFMENLDYAIGGDLGGAVNHIDDFIHMVDPENGGNQ